MSTSTSNLIWYIGRGSGITAYILLTVSVVLGIALSRRWYSSHWPRMVVDELHRWLTVTFYVFIVIHVVTMWIDPFTHFKLTDVTVPFASTYRPLWLSLGIIGAELAVASGASVWVRKWIGYRAWHVLHLMAYPIFFMSLLHGVGTGSDTKTTWMTAIYIISFLLVAGATLWRLIEIPAWRTGVIATTIVTAVALVALGHRRTVCHWLGQERWHSRKAVAGSGCATRPHHHHNYYQPTDDSRIGTETPGQYSGHDDRPDALEPTADSGPAARHWSGQCAARHRHSVAGD